MDYKIVKAQKEHLPEIERLIISTRISEGLNEQDKTAKFWVAIKDKRVIGCGGFNLIDSKNVYLTHLAVEKDLRRKGVGMSIFGKLMEEAEKLKAETVSFITMYYHFNKFKKRGFRTIPRKELNEPLRSYPLYTSPRYKKCAVMIKEN